MRKRTVVLLVLAVILLPGIVAVGVVYHLFLGPAVETGGRAEVELLIPTGSDEGDVYRMLVDSAYVKNPKALTWLMERKNYNGSRVVSGKYTLTSGMSMNELLDHLRHGNGEEEVMVTFNAARTLAELAGSATANIEADSSDLARLLHDPEVERKYGFTRETFLSMFLPDTYYMEWDTDAEEFVERMAEEYRKFWNEFRMAKAARIGLDRSEVVTLASIVQAEQQLFPDERPTIAGLYLNRLRRGMRLQSDPTVVYAIGDFSINRVLTKHLATPSPYNTYIHAGLPPGPINVPSKQSIDAVLNAEENDYLYMCAKEDFSGYHAFATNLNDHNKNARRFQRALNERKIFR